MPEITSPLRALRLSGRLMVIQNALPRFSHITLVLSVIVPLACFAHALANICRRIMVDCKPDQLLRAVAGGAFFIQTLLSWNAAPPIGATTSAPVSVLMPRP